MKKWHKFAIKSTLVAGSIALLSACGGGDTEVVVVTQESGSFLSVDNLLNYGVVCVNNIVYDAYSPQGQQVARDLIDFYGTYNFSLSPIHNAYSAPTYCGGATSNYVPSPGLIIDASYYYNVIVPRVR
jgi:hypothetical protein